MREVLEELARCQRRWMRLDAAFSCVDVQRQLAEQFQTLNEIDGCWKETMESNPHLV